MSAQGSTSPFSFEAWAAKDTFLTFEKINYELRVKNIADTNTVCRLPLNDCYASFQLFDTSGLEIPHIIGSCYEPKNDRDTLEPGDSTMTWIGVHADVLSASERRQLGYGWLPTGAYRCVFNWVYDPLQYNYINADGQMYDTVSLWVVTPDGGQDAQVMDAYVSTMRNWRADLDTLTDYKQYLLAKHAMFDAFRAIADSFPSSTYSKQLRQEYIVDLNQRVHDGDYDRRAATDYALKFITDYPNEFDAARFVHYFSNGGYGRDQRFFLREVLSLVPNTRAGERAKQLLDHPESRFGDSWDRVLRE